MRTGVNAALATALAVACSDGQPLPGEVNAALLSPHGREGAVAFEVDAVIVEIEAPSLTNVFSEVVDDRTRVILVARSATDFAFRFIVPDVNRPPEVRILEVASPTNELRTSLDGYRVDLARVR